MTDEDLIRESDALHRAVRLEVAEWGPKSPRAFDDLAIAIARFQVARVDVVRRLATARGVDVDALRSIDDFPAVPTDVFRMRRVAAHAKERDQRVFRTSGTTHGQRGAHHLRDLRTYEEAAMASGARMLWRDEPPDRVLVLAPSAREAPDSSLSFMIDLFAERLGVPTTHHLGPDGIDWPGLKRAVADARRANHRTLVLGTSFAFVFLLDGLKAGLASDLTLPKGSRAMLTGGFKGRSREVDESELRAMLSEKIGVAARDIVGEYGMTELSSQLYESPHEGAVRRYEAPPWTRVTVVDPVTLTPLPLGSEGLCRIVDLANVDSAIAVQTLDRVRIVDDGIILLGRAKGAQPRGCSLAIEEIFSEGGL